MKRVLEAGEVFYSDQAEPTVYLDPWLRSHSMVLISGDTGCGKSKLMTLLSICLTTGLRFLRYRVVTPCKVLYVDGENGVVECKDNLRSMANALETDIPAGKLGFTTLEQWGGVVPNLSIPDDQDKYRVLFRDYDVIILDNLQTLAPETTDRDGDVARWNRIQPFLLEQRLKGRCIILVHHTNKSGDQDGTKKKENVMNNTILLNTPGAFQNSHDLHVEWRFKKGRSLPPVMKRPMFLTMHESDLGFRWMWEELIDVHQRYADTHRSLSARQLSEALSITLDQAVYLKANTRVEEDDE